MSKTFLVKLSLILWFLFTLTAYGDVTFVDGDSELLRLLVHTKRLSGKPVIIFNEAGSDSKARISLLKSNVVGDFIFKDSDPNDIALKLTADYEVLLPDQNNPVSIKVTKSAEYSIYFDTESINSYETLKRLSAVIDGHTLLYAVDAEKTNRFALFARVLLKKGVHKIFFSAEGNNSSPINISLPLRMLLISEASLQETEILKRSIIAKLDQGSSSASYIFEKNSGDFFIPAQSALRNYTVSVGLKPKVLKIPISFYSQAQQKAAPWVYGLLQDDKTWPFVISRNRNYGPDKKIAHYLVLNPNNTSIKGSLSQTLTDASLKHKLLKIFVNRIPLSDFNSNMLFYPGFNQIDLVFRDAINNSDASFPMEEVLPKNYFKNDVPVRPDAFAKADCSVKANVTDCTFFSDQPVILSKIVDVDIKEYPLFDSAALVINGREYNPRLILFLDLGGDNKKIEVLEIDSSAATNLLEMVKAKWPHRDNKSRLLLKRILVVIDYKGIGYNNNLRKNILTVKNLPHFYNDETIVVAANDIPVEKITYENKNIDGNLLVKNKHLNIFFNLNSHTLKKAAIQSDSQLGEMRFTIPIDIAAIEKFPYFSFDYLFGKDYTVDLKFFVSAQNFDKTIVTPIRQYSDYGNHIEIDLRTIPKGDYAVHSIVIVLNPKENVSSTQSLAPELYKCVFSNFTQFQKFPYPMISQKNIEHYLELLNLNNPAIMKIDGRVFRLLDFWHPNDITILDPQIFSLQTNLKSGSHYYEYLEDHSFISKWVLLDSLASKGQNKSSSPIITFMKINPAKYTLKFENANKPFWLIFNESYHPSWRLYLSDIINTPILSNEVVTMQYPYLGIQEKIRGDKFLMRDVSYLTKKPLSFLHMKVNGYANGWYIDPIKDVGSEDFTLVLFFWPQAFFYLGALITVFAFLASFVLLLFFKRK